MKALLRTVLEHTTSLIVVLDEQGQVQYASPSVERVLGYDSKEILQSNWWCLTREDVIDQEQIQTKISDFIASGESRLPGYVQTLMTNWGSPKFIQWDTMLLPEGQVVGIGQDITAQKQTENELIRLNQELRSVFTDVKDSLHYASRLQRAILKHPDVMQEFFADGFVLYAPKDQVSGDIYWIEETKDHVFVAVIDCTGHGAPGALLSMVANTLLKDIVLKRGVDDPGEILDLLDYEFVRYMNENMTDGTIPDGMDLALCRFSKDLQEMAYAAANRPAFILRDEEFMELEPTKSPIGFEYDFHKIFRSQTVSLKRGDQLYLFSDGYVDQFGGEKGKKFSRKRFKQVLCDAQALAGEDQKSYLWYTFRNWKQTEEQIDDVTVVGIHV